MKRERSAAVTRLVLLVALAAFLAAVGKPMPASGGESHVKLRHCTPEGYGLEWRNVAPTAQAPQEVRLTAGWATAKEKRRTCLLRTTIRVTISGSSGEPLYAHWNVKSVRRPWTGIVHTWVWRNWCQTDSQANPKVTFSDPGERTITRRIANPPACVSPGAPSTLDDVGTGAKYVPRSDRFPPHILPKRAPPPLQYELIKPKNGWLVSDGHTLVAVYAGSPGPYPSIGRFAIIRQSEVLGFQYNPPDIVDAGRIGAVKIIHPPRGRSRETTAQFGHLAFVSANGTKGFLDLTGDRVRITGRAAAGG